MEFIIESGAVCGDLPHYWRKCVGSCHAATALREDWRRQLARCSKELGFEYVRFHGLLDDDMSVYKKTAEGAAEYSFFNIDSIFDFLLGIGMKPFVELGFMPEDLASGRSTIFHYRGNVTPPRDYDEWGRLIGSLTRHLVDRYGVDEVSRWFFEVWNEPNLSGFWAGTKREYFMLYQAAAGAIKAVDARLRVGGPATACNAWIPEFKDFCAASGVPLDFISTHHYPTDAAIDLGPGLDFEEQMARSRRGVCREMTEKAAREAGDLKLYYTEWNNTPSPRDPYHDDPYAAAFAVKTIVDNIGLVGIYSFWTFSDIFEECGQSSLPFHGGFGLMNIHGIPKPTYRAFQLLNMLGNERLAVQGGEEESTVECIASRCGSEIVALVYNHNVPLAPIRTETVVLTVEGAGQTRSATARRVGPGHADAKRAWEALGRPEYPDAAVLRALMKASETVTESLECHAAGGKVSVTLDVEPHTVVAVVFGE